MPKTKQTAAPKFQVATNRNGQEGHNVSWAETQDAILIRLDLNTPRRNSKSSGKPMLASSLGYVGIGEGSRFGLNLNVMDNTNKTGGSK